MLRRGFFRSLACGLGAALGLGAPARAGAVPDPEVFARVFRHDGEAWREIVWEDMRPGDKVLVLGLWRGTLDQLYAAEVAGTPDAGKLGSPVEMAYTREMLPRIWGNPRGHEVQLVQGQAPAVNVE